jgi:hypothetical protein
MCLTMAHGQWECDSWCRNSSRGAFSLRQECWTFSTDWNLLVVGRIRWKLYLQLGSGAPF